MCYLIPTCSSRQSEQQSLQPSPCCRALLQMLRNLFCRCGTSSDRLLAWLLLVYCTVLAFFVRDLICSHGYNLGQHRLPSCKLNVYDHDIRIPMVIMGPGIEADSTFDFIGSNVDVAPTFLALAGIDATTDITPPMDGKSVASKLIKTVDSGTDNERVLNKAVPTATASSVARELALLGAADDDAAEWRDHHWVEYYSLGNVTRTGHLVDDSTSNTYRALRFFGSEKYGNTLYAEFTAVEDWHFEADLFIEMYDLDKDPHELHNLASTAPAALKAELHEMVLKQFACEGETCT
jgi:N-acetylglucosamine-6-sulfatase